MGMMAKLSAIGNKKIGTYKKPSASFIQQFEGGSCQKQKIAFVWTVERGLNAMTTVIICAHWMFSQFVHDATG